VKVVSVKNPWAFALVAGWKTVENRAFPVRHRGPLLIHASLSRSDLGAESDRMPALPPYDELVYGAIIGAVELVDCVRLDEVADLAYAIGPWCWLVANPRRLPAPHTCRGRLGLWTWTPPPGFRLPH